MWDSMDSYVQIVFVLNADDTKLNFRVIYLYKKRVNYNFTIRSSKNHYE